MGKGYRIIQHMLPDRSVIEDYRLRLWAEGDGTEHDGLELPPGVTTGPLEETGLRWPEPPPPFTLYWDDSPLLAVESWPRGPLDLGIEREASHTLARNNLELFHEEFIKLEGGSVDFGFYRDGRWWSGEGDENLAAALPADADLDGLEAAGQLRRDPGPPPGVFAPWLLDALSIPPEDQ